MLFRSDVIGMPVSAATEALVNASLAVETRPAWDASVPEGSVVDAEPAPGTTVRHDTRVQLVVSKGPERYNVPDITGESVGSARAALTRVKLVVGTTSYAYSDSVSRGRIMSSNPAAGRVARPGDKVDVVVSKGPAPIAVPSVAGRSASSAQSTLQSAGFSTSTSSIYDDRVPAGTVIRSQPRAGVLLQRGSSVQLIVSKGPAPVKVPDVFRLSESKAVSLLKAAGLKVRVTKASGRLLNLVKSQSPSAGTVVPHGSTVTITIV